MPGYSRYSKCWKQDMARNRTRLKTGVRGDIYNKVAPCSFLHNVSQASVLGRWHRPVRKTHRHTGAYLLQKAGYLGFYTSRIPTYSNKVDLINEVS